MTVPSLWLAAHLANVDIVTPTLAGACGVVAVGLTVLAVRSRRQTLRKIVRESLGVHIIGGLVSIAAGIMIEKRLDAFITYPAVLVVIPPFLAMCGAVGGIFSARVSTKLHLGLVDASHFRLLAVVEDLAVAVALALPMFLALGASADVVGALAGLASPGALEMVEVILLAGGVSIAALLVIGYLGTVTTYRFGLDPDNFAIPVVTSTLDLLGAAAVILALVVVGVI